MENRFYLVKILTNDKGEDATTIAFYTDVNNAIVNYHNTLAAYHNAPDVLFAVVQILDGSGNTLGGKYGYIETVDHRETPTPNDAEE